MTKEQRKSETYRAARRNEVLRGKVRGTWVSGIKTIDRPYMIKPPKLKFAVGVPGVADGTLISIKERKQPKLYSYKLKEAAE